MAKKVLCYSSNRFCSRRQSPICLGEWRRAGRKMEMECVHLRMQTPRNAEWEIYFNRGNWAEQKGLTQVSENDYFENNPIPGTNGCNCYYVYMHHLRDMPKTALIQAGIKSLDESVRYIETPLETRKEQARKSSEPNSPKWKRN